MYASGFGALEGSVQPDPMTPGVPQVCRYSSLDASQVASALTAIAREASLFLSSRLPVVVAPVRAEHGDGSPADRVDVVPRVVVAGVEQGPDLLPQLDWRRGVALRHISLCNTLPRITNPHMAKNNRKPSKPIPP